MKRLLALALAVSAGAAIAVYSAGTPQAADHTDPPAVAGNGAADINDLYAWMDNGALALAITVEPGAGDGATLSNALQYAFHINRGDGSTEVICQYDSPATTTCFVGTAAGFTAVQGDASAEAGFTDPTSGVQMFSGLRNDPFYFNLAGLGATATFVQDNNLLAATPVCPDLTAGPVNDAPSAGEAALQCLTTACDVGPGDAGNAPATDTFGAQNVVALVVRVPLTLVNGNGNTLAVWASTHNR